MAENFLGRIMPVGFNFAPRNFALCNGQLLAIAQNQALFSLLGTQFGGNGTTNFALPDLRSRTPVAFGSSADPGWNPSPMSIGEQSGTENVTLLTTQLPTHNHQVLATTSDASSRNPSGRLLATSTDTAVDPAMLYAPSSGPVVAMNPASVGVAGSTQPHSNVQPYTTINFCIALAGVFPSRN